MALKDLNPPISNPDDKNGRLRPTAIRAMYIVIPIFVLLLIIIAFLIWYFLKHQPKKERKKQIAQGGSVDLEVQAEELQKLTAFREKWKGGPLGR